MLLSTFNFQFGDIADGDDRDDLICRCYSYAMLGYNLRYQIVENLMLIDYPFLFYSRPVKPLIMIYLFPL